MSGEHKDDDCSGPRVLLVDDHPLVGASLGSAIEKHGGRVSTAETLAEARQTLAEEHVDILLLDINFPEGLGTDLLREPEVGERIPARSFLITGALDPDDIMLAFDDGARGYISKGIAFEQLESALGQIIGNEIPSGDALIWDSTQSTFRPVGDVFDDRPLLSPREREVFRLLRQGLQDKEIASRVGRSIHTVRVQLRSIRRKRGYNRRAETDAGARP